MQLERTVAIKSLPDAVAGDPERIERFEREARAVAALHHPRIASLFGIEETIATSASCSLERRARAARACPPIAA